MTVIWGSTFWTTQMGAVDAGGGWSGPALFMFVRFTIASLLFAIFIPSSLRSIDRGTLVDAAAMGAIGFAGFQLQLVGLMDTTPTLSAFLASLTVICTPLLEWVFLRKPPSKTLLLGCLVALGGIFIMTNPLDGAFGKGEFWSLLSAVAFSIYLVWANRVTARRSPEAITSLSMMTIALLAFLFLIPTIEGRAALLSLPSRVQNARFLWPCLYNALFGSVLALWIFYRFQRYLPATRAAIIYSLEPVFAAVMSWSFIGEPMTPRKISGGVLILAANLICELGTRNSKA